MRAALAAAVLLGGLQAASFAPIGAWWLQPLSLAALAWLAWDAPARRAAGLGFAFGLGWLGAGLWWLYVSLHDFGGLPPPLAGGAVALLVAFLSVYPALALGAWAGLPVNPHRRVVRAVLWACAWLAGELARAQWFTGFPWIAGGYAHSHGVLAAWVPWVGVYGVGFLAALWAATAAAAVRGSRWPVAVVTLGLLAGSGLPAEFTESSGRLRVTLLQPNVPQSQKFDPQMVQRNLEALLAQIEAARTPLVVTPESVLPVPMAYLPAEPVARLRAASAERVLWMGTFLGSDDEGWVNSMLALRDGDAVHDYGKRHLLPFGEFIPPGFGWFVKALRIPIDSQARGLHERPLRVEGLRLRALICYEVLFGEDVVRSAVAGPDEADAFVNTSNLAWFGAHLVQDQHLQFSQLRALEFQRPVLHATNTGATAQVDHRGQVVARVPALRREALVVEVDGRRGSTPYARWLSAWGLWPLWVLALAPLLVACAGPLRARRGTRPA